MNFQNKVVLITGSGRGIGASLALAFAQSGASVIVNYFHSKKEAILVVNKIKTLGRKAIAIKADVSKRKDVEFLVNEAIRKFGRIDVLINNAGIVESCSWENISEKDWHRTIDINLKGVFECGRIVGQQMLKQKYGKIINIVSLRGFLGAEDIMAYAAAKAGVINLTKSFAKAFAPFVNVNCLCLGPINVGMNQKNNLERNKQLTNQTLIKRLGKIEDVINGVRFLASDKSSFITGHILMVDGGANLK